MITTASSVGISGPHQLCTAWLVASVLKVLITIVLSLTTVLASEIMDPSSRFWLSLLFTCLHKSILLVLPIIRRSMNVKKMMLKNLTIWKCVILILKVLLCLYYVHSFWHLHYFSLCQSYGKLFNNSVQFVNLEKHRRNTKISSQCSMIHQRTGQPWFKETMMVKTVFEEQFNNLLIFAKVSHVNVMDQLVLTSLCLVRSFLRVTLDLKLELISWLIYRDLEINKMFKEPTQKLILMLKVLAEYQKLHLMELQGSKVNMLLFLI